MPITFRPPPDLALVGVGITIPARLARMAGSAMQMSTAVVLPPGGGPPVLWQRRADAGAESDTLLAAGCAADSLAMLGVPLLLTDAACTQCEWAQLLHRAAGWRAVAAVGIPDVYGLHPGTLVVADVTPHVWTDDDVVLLRDLALVAAER